MSSFYMLDEYFITGEKYDEDHGFRESVEQDGGDYEPYMVEFIRAFANNDWDTVRVHVPLPMCHEKCDDRDLVKWYTKVHCGHYVNLVFVGVFRSL